MEKVEKQVAHRIIHSIKYHSKCIVKIIKCTFYSDVLSMVRVTNMIATNDNIADYVL